MLNIAICTKDNSLRKILETVVTQVLSSNYLEFHLTEISDCKDISKEAVLVLGDSTSLADYELRKMMIVILDNHKDDEKLAKNCIPFFIEKDEINTKLFSVFSAWVDYYFDNYHYSINELEDFILADVIYFSIEGHKKITAHFRNKQLPIELKKDYSIFYQGLPLNFLIIGTEYIINLDELIEIKNGDAVLSNGQVICNVDTKKTRERQKRYQKTEISDVYIGDKYSLEKIKKARLQGGAVSLVFGYLLACLLTGSHFSVLCLLATLIVGACLFLPHYLTFLGSTGNYYELRQDGLHYYEALGMLKRFKWSQAIAHHQEDDVMSFIPYDEIAYVRLGTRESTAPMGAAFLYLDQKNYSLLLRIETTTASLDFEETSIGNIFLAQQRRDNIAHILNSLLLRGKEVEGNSNLLIVLNDPNASIQQYMTKRNSDY